MQPFLDIGTLVIFQMWRQEDKEMELVMGIITRVNRKIWNNHRIFIPKYDTHRMENRCKLYLYTEKNWESLHKERTWVKN
jgi:hypothetical protein